MAEIRKVRWADIPALGGVYAHVYNSLDIGESWTRASASDLLTYYFNAHPELAYLAEVDKQIAGGFLAGVKPWCDGNHLYDGEIFVDPRFQRQGIGKQLMVTVFDEAIRIHRVTAWDAITYTSRPHPLSWYKKLGFEETPGLTMISCDVPQVLERLKAL